MLSAIIFDFDGVILESVSVKTTAFRHLFSFYPEHVDEIVQYHLENGGMSRFEKFRYIYQNILNEKLSEERFETLSARFSTLVEKAVADAPYVDGAPDLLECCSKRYPLFIVSATPQEELIRIAKSRGIDPFFRGIFGSPVKKTEHIRRIAAENNFNPAEVIFVGDAVNDYQAALSTGVRFIARITPGEPDRFINLSGIEQRISTLHDLKKYLEANS
jgi:beta-phosphoglucomutase